MGRGKRGENQEGTAGPDSISSAHNIFVLFSDFFLRRLRNVPVIYQPTRGQRGEWGDKGTTAWVDKQQVAMATKTNTSYGFISTKSRGNVISQ